MSNGQIGAYKLLWRLVSLGIQVYVKLRQTICKKI